MTVSIKFKGLDTVLKNLNKEIKGIGNRTASGVYKAAMHVRRESQKLCPVVTGNLKNSAYVVGMKSSQTSASFEGKNSSKLSGNHNRAVSEARKELDGSKHSGIFTNPAAVIGYSANYAAFVHENPRAGKTEGVSPKGKEYKAPMLPSGKRSQRKVFSTVGQYKFLEQPLITERKRILEIIKQDAKL